MSHLVALQYGKPPPVFVMTDPISQLPGSGTREVQGVLLKCFDVAPQGEQKIMSNYPGVPLAGAAAWETILMIEVVFLYIITVE